MNEVRKLSVKNNPEQLELIRDFIEDLGEVWQFNPDLVFRLNLILEEYISNLISYGFSDQLSHEISLEIIKEDSSLTLQIKDDGNPFDITEYPENEDVDKPIEERKIGGLGIHFIRSLADKIDYSSEAGVNTLLLEVSTLHSIT